MTNLKQNGKIYQRQIVERDEKMVIQDERKEKTCCFYVSEFRLEMILGPYINERIDENITILTEKKLKETLEILISKINLKEENREKILKLGWNGDEKIKENSNIIIIGSKEFIKNKKEELENKNILSVLDCYNFEEEKDDIENILKQYTNSLNTLGIKLF